MSNYIKRTVGEHLLILGLFTFLAVILTYPVAWQMFTHIAGDGEDGLQNVWNIWHVNQVMIEGG